MVSIQKKLEPCLPLSKAVNKIPTFIFPVRADEVFKRSQCSWILDSCRPYIIRSIIAPTARWQKSKAFLLCICHILLVMDTRFYFRHRNYFPTITIKIMTKQNLISILLVNLIGHTFCYWRSRERNIKLPFHICAGLLCYRNYFPTITIKIMTKQNLK